MRDAKNSGGEQARLLATAMHGTGVVAGQVKVGKKTTEIPLLEDVLDQIGDLAGPVFTLDTLHTHKDTARLITNRGAD